MYAHLYIYIYMCIYWCACASMGMWFPLKAPAILAYNSAGSPRTRVFVLRPVHFAPGVHGKEVHREFGSDVGGICSSDAIFFGTPLGLEISFLGHKICFNNLLRSWAVLGFVLWNNTCKHLLRALRECPESAGATFTG